MLSKGTHSKKVNSENQILDVYELLKSPDRCGDGSLLMKVDIKKANVYVQRDL